MSSSKLYFSISISVCDKSESMTSQFWSAHLGEIWNTVHSGKACSQSQRELDKASQLCQLCLTEIAKDDLEDEIKIKRRRTKNFLELKAFERKGRFSKAWDHLERFLKEEKDTSMVQGEIPDPTGAFLLIF